MKSSKIAVLCSQQRSTFSDKREGTTTTSLPKTAAPASRPLPAGIENKGALKNGEIEFKSEHRENENIPGSKTRKGGLAIIERQRASSGTSRYGRERERESPETRWMFDLHSCRHYYKVK